MSNLTAIVNELRELDVEGSKLLNDGQEDDMSLGTFAPRYERWYTKARAAVAQIIPERLPEFVEAYRHADRKTLVCDTYAISDFLLALQVSQGEKPLFNRKQIFAFKLLRQLGIVKSAIDAAPSALRDIRAVLRSELLDSDLSAARDLLKANHLRSAGIVCGVVLETHLKDVCAVHEVELGKKDSTIGDYNDALRSKGVYDVPTWRLIQRLADIRNICGHRKERDPKLDEVEDLVDGTDKIIKEIA